MLTPLTQGTIVGSLVIAAVLGRRFYLRQAEGATGGRISLPKIAWLVYPIYAWFLLCPLLALDPGVPRGVRLVLGAFAVSMWLRGAIEMYLLYKVHRWRPPYGIAHDAFCLALIGGLTAWSWDEVTLEGSAGRCWMFVAVIAASLVVEILYAALFFQAVHGKTTGQEGIWFADEGARFRRINRITATCNAVLFSATVVFLISTLR